MRTLVATVVRGLRARLLLQPVGADAADDGLPLYLAELDVAFLLGDSESRNPDLNYCVFGSDARPLYCSRIQEISRSGFIELAQEQGNRSNFQVDWNNGTAVQQVSVRSIFLDQQFGVAQPWRLWVSHPRADVFKTLPLRLLQQKVCKVLGYL